MVKIAVTLFCVLFVGLVSIAQETKTQTAPKSAHKSQQETNPNTAWVARGMFSVKRLKAEIETEKTNVNESERRAWEYKDAYLYWLRQRSFPYDTINWVAYIHAFLHFTSNA